jgi:predicted MPP superfamily phosphohydrolase
MGDTQNYAEYSVWDLYRKQAQWIKDHKIEKNFKFVIHMGDMIENNPNHWPIARSALNILTNAGIPFSPLLGNHDYDNNLSNRDSYHYNKAENFGVNNFIGNSNYEGYGSMENNNDNAFHWVSPQGAYRK